MRNTGRRETQSNEPSSQYQFHFEIFADLAAQGKKPSIIQLKSRAAAASASSSSSSSFSSGIFRMLRTEKLEFGARKRGEAVENPGCLLIVKRRQESRKTIKLVFTSRSNRLLPSSKMVDIGLNISVKPMKSAKHI